MYVVASQHKRKPAPSKDGVAAYGLLIRFAVTTEGWPPNYANFLLPFHVQKNQAKSIDVYEGLAVEAKGLRPTANRPVWPLF